MTQQADIEKFLALKSVAVVGASRDRNKYGNIIYRHLRDRGVKVYAVNRVAGEVEGDPSYPSLDRLPEKPEGVIVIVPPAETEKVVRAAHAAGIASVWMQPGAESAEAVRYCEAEGMCVIWDNCILVESRRAGL